MSTVLLWSITKLIAQDHTTLVQQYDASSQVSCNIHFNHSNLTLRGNNGQSFTQKKKLNTDWNHFQTIVIRELKRKWQKHRSQTIDWKYSNFIAPPLPWSPNRNYGQQKAQNLLKKLNWSYAFPSPGCSHLSFIS
jgi:hypothetical protein